MNESLRLTPADMPDWFMDSGHSAGDNKIPHVILNDKLMTDALLGTAPIKTEHSYSLTSDGVSIPHSNSDGNIDIELLNLYTLVENSSKLSKVLEFVAVMIELLMQLI